MSERAAIVVAKDAEQVCQLAASAVSELIGSSVEARGVCYVALAGGATPLRVYQILAIHALRIAIDWRHVHLFFGDERMVPPDDPASNYGMVSRELLGRIPIPHENVHRIRGEILPADSGKEYDAELQRVFDGQRPRFDILILGVGEDGHTASLFPGTDALTEVARMAIGTFVPQLKSWRVTLTFPVLLNARETLFLATGRRKASVVARIVEAGEPQTDLPASMVRPRQGRVTWMLDEEAAASLSPATRRLEGLTGRGAT